MALGLKYPALLLSLFLICFGEKPTLQEFKISGQAQGTTYAVNYFAEKEVVTKAQVDSIFEVIDLSMSLYKKNSTIIKFNTMSAGRIKVNPHMKTVLEKSFQINVATDGLFDVTIQPLMRLWGLFADEIDSQPDTSKIKALLNSTIGVDKIKLKGNFLSKKNNHVEIDLNGIAQGYTVDVIADFLESKAIKSYVVEVGGEIRAKGPKPDGSLIRVGVERPPVNDFEDAGLSHVVSFVEGSITTSGNYRKYIVFGGKKYGHIINPKTGYPINNEIISVTVFAKKAIDADGYDNALMLMPVEKALKFVETKKGIDAYIIYKKPDGKVADTLTAGFKKLILN
ncbi:FAD:protein FMN transferase [Pedobacter polaris]|uniref:FAD:protein FMN transferase n=1 Tax=Pedobacter polaris TaxID=2571273 RepID=A0A4U1CSP7_9SPHI|nr:FAD:protein FMN transferase [Pedobacter polaris]TKC12157.1 FAD:protein FMN transferase [Pedobacter polaris]